MESTLINKAWIVALLAAAPFMVNAQQLTASAVPKPEKPKAGLPVPPPHQKPDKPEGPKPAPEKQDLVTLSGSIGKPVANSRFEYDAVSLKTSDNEVLMKFPPHLGEQLIGKNSNSNGKFTGFYHTAPDGKKEFRLVSADINGQAIKDVPPPLPKTNTAQQQKVINAEIKSLSYSPKKEVNGFALSSGEYVSIPPHVAKQLASQLKSGEKVTVNGFIEAKRQGVVYSEDVVAVKAQTITLNGQSYLIP